MYQRVKFGSHEVLIGLDWDAPSSSQGSEGSMIRSMLRSEIHRGCRFGAVVRTIDSSNVQSVAVGFVPATEKLRPKLPSAASLLAQASYAKRMSGSVDSMATTTGDSGNWLVIEKLDDDHYWLACIQQGAPMPTSDIVGSYEQILEKSHEFLRNKGDYVVHCADEDMRSQLAMEADTSANGFAALIDSTDGLRINEAIPKQIAGLRMSVFLLAVGMLVVVLGTIVFVHWRNARAAEEAQARARAAAAAAAAQEEAGKRDYREKVQEAIKAALVKGKKTIDQALGTPSPALTIQAWASIIQRIDADQAGWTISGITCQAGNEPACQVSLSRGDAGVNRLLMDLHPDASIEGDKATLLLKGDHLSNRPANWDHLDNAQGMMVNLVSDLQLLRNGGLEYHQETSKEIVQDVEMPQSPYAKFQPGSTNNVGPAPNVQMGVASGKMGVGGKDLWQLVDLGEFLDHDGISLDALTLSVDSNGPQNWKLDSTYYLRSKPQPILPVVLVDGKAMTLTLPKEFEEMHQATGGVQASAGQGATLQDETGPAKAGSTAAPLALPPPPPPPPVGTGPGNPAPNPIQHF